jgi:hypothetical protein
MASSSAPRRGRASVAFGSEAEVLPAGSATTHTTPFRADSQHAPAAAARSHRRIEQPDTNRELVIVGGVLASGSRCSACWVGMNAVPAMKRQIARKRGADFEWTRPDYLHLLSRRGAHRCQCPAEAGPCLTANAVSKKVTGQKTATSTAPSWRAKQSRIPALVANPARASEGCEGLRRDPRRKRDPRRRDLTPLVAADDRSPTRSERRRRPSARFRVARGATARWRGRAPATHDSRSHHFGPRSPSATLAAWTRSRAARSASAS